ncbi:tRNA glutamyl-Q(34) synthetase GluQRS [Methylobacterium sp. BTF04]|uniref:tRNA glutamyl-Q(34) synthetase GluQRS n=1 Tax=Methylobacterium sp. BTF04 TaxID=2708300 RepID=UPI0013D78A32|nr:tRNA glutamyl-Q(34) synthetase GluQRS [Methylobacterium sp. BTF04]NEU13577.1 tRNA glutamyl-Q(34) synthetase GluQRS [Methylobacterium sp. BTF04]
MTRPVFRFAPSPNGRLHLGHAASALLNADLAHRMSGRLLLRMEDIDPGRSRPELAAAICDDLAWLGLRFDGAVRYQSEHLGTYRAQVMEFAARGLAYPCFCSRSVIAAAVGAEAAATRQAIPRDPDGAPFYPGTCRHLSDRDVSARLAAGQPHTWRLDMGRAMATAPGPHHVVTVEASPDAAVGVDVYPLPKAVGQGEAADPARWGDAVIARRDVPTSYHLAVVMDDAAQGITHVVRGADLRAATDLHVLLQALIAAPSPRYHHHPLIRDAHGDKLAKSRGSPALADLRAAGITPEAIRRELGFRDVGFGA